MEIIDEYIRRVTEDVPVALGASYKVVVDCGNGTASVAAVELIEALGMEVLPLYCESDGTFPNHHPDPTVDETLREMISLVRLEKADLGVAFDGDGDRIGIVDEKGEYRRAALCCGMQGRVI